MMDWDRITQTGARTPGVRADPARLCGVCRVWHSPRLRSGKEVPIADTKGGDKLAILERMLGVSLSDRPPGRSHLKCTPSSRTGENPPYGMSEGVMETSASFEVRSAPLPYSTEGGGPGFGYGSSYPGTKLETADTDKDHPTVARGFLYSEMKLRQYST